MDQNCHNFLSPQCAGHGLRAADLVGESRRVERGLPVATTLVILFCRVPYLAGIWHRVSEIASFTTTEFHFYTAQQLTLQIGQRVGLTGPHAGLPGGFDCFDWVL